MPPGVNFGPLKVEIGLLGVYFEHLRIDFDTLWESMLGIWEPILDLWESFLALKGKCKLLSFYFMPIGVDYGSLGVNFLATVSQLGASGSRYWASMNQF